jgi:hypothetical protein
MTMYKLRLFVTGRTPQSQRAINNLRDDLREARSRAPTKSR